jgi:hypothetical protein
MRLGYKFNHTVAVEAVNYSSTVTVKEATWGPNVISSINQKMTISVTAIDVKLQHSLSKLQPYILLGYGNYRYEADFSHTAIGKTFTASAYQSRVGVGLALLIMPELYANIGYVSSWSVDTIDVGLSFRF